MRGGCDNVHGICNPKWFSKVLVYPDNAGYMGCDLTRLWFLWLIEKKI